MLTRLLLSKERRLAGVSPCSPFDKRSDNRAAGALVWAVEIVIAFSRDLLLKAR
jgi:hypothetical protein